VDAIDLRVGDVLLLQSGEEVPVTGLAVRHERLAVYNFQVEELHCYAVGASGVLVHNNSGEEGNFKGSDALRKHKDVVRSLVKQYNLNKAQQRQLHDEITGMHYTQDEIADIISSMFGKNKR
jgi:hypothetical protein